MWDIKEGNAICGSPLNSESSNCVKFLNQSNKSILTVGHHNITLWTYDASNNKLRKSNINLGQLKRIFNCIKIDKNDNYAYCGTTSGDLLQVILFI